jgi:exosome complex component RRP40
MFVMPGTAVEGKLLAPGISYSGANIIVTKPGMLRTTNGQQWVASRGKRYVPSKLDPVVGVISARRAEFYAVQIGAAQSALLPILAFEGAHRQNRPILEVGAVVYCKVSLSHRDMDPEVECVNQDGKSGGFGELKKGFVVKTSLQFSRRFFKFNHVVF